MCPFWNLLLVINPKIYLGRTLFHYAASTLFPLWRMLFLAFAVFGIEIPKLVLEVHLFIMWFVPKCALFGTCCFWNVSFLERAVFGMCCFWNVLFLECAVFGICPFWNVPYLTDLVTEL